MIKKITTTLSLTTASYLLPLVALAQNVSGIGDRQPGTLNIGTSITNITGWLLGLLIALALLFIVYAAFLFLLGGQSEGNIEKAKNIIIYAAVAIAIGLGAQVVYNVVNSLIAR